MHVIVCPYQNVPSDWTIDDDPKLFLCVEDELEDDVYVTAVDKLFHSKQIRMTFNKALPGGKFLSWLKVISFLTILSFSKISASAASVETIQRNLQQNADPRFQQLIIKKAIPGIHMFLILIACQSKKHSARK